MTDPQDLAARPAFAGLLVKLRGGDGPCLACKGEKVRPGSWTFGGVPVRVSCPACSGSGRVAVPPDPHPGLAGAVVADWFADQGGNLAGMLVLYAGLTGPCPVKCAAAYLCPRCGGTGELPDPCLSAALAAWDDALCPPRAAAVRELGLEQTYSGHWESPWHVASRKRGRLTPDLNEPAAKLALKRAVLTCYDPGNPYDGGAGVLVQCPVCEGSGMQPGTKPWKAPCAFPPCDGSGRVKPSSLLPAADGPRNFIFPTEAEHRRELAEREATRRA
jgi:hypothetical protein